MSAEQKADIEKQYERIGIRPGDRLPMLRGLKGESDYLIFLRQVPDGTGIRGFTAAMARHAER